MREPLSEPAVAAVDPRQAPAPSAQRLLTLPNGLEIACQSAKEAAHFFDDIFCQQVYLSHGISLSDDACVFDVGGNIGLFTVFLHQRFHHISTYTFEPAPPLFKLLHFNVARYGGQAKLFPCGVSSRSGQASFTFYPYSSGMSSFYADEEEEREVLRTVLANQRAAGDSAAAEVLVRPDDFLSARLVNKTFECPLVTLSQVFRQEGVTTVDLLKIDVQKSEFDVLQGIAPEDWPKIRQVVVEIHDLDGRLAMMTDYLAERGFDVTREQEPLYQGSIMYNVYALRRGATR